MEQSNKFQDAQMKINEDRYDKTRSDIAKMHEFINKVQTGLDLNSGEQKSLA